jgi:hypothetical protein
VDVWYWVISCWCNKKKYKKYKLSGKCKDSNIKQMKANIQKEQRTTAYWQYIEKMICNIQVELIPFSVMIISGICGCLVLGHQLLV